MRGSVGLIVALWLVLVVLLPWDPRASAQNGPAETRVALVIGNGVYQHAAPLNDVHNDADAVGSAFERLGFRVSRVENAGFEDLRRALSEFGPAARSADIAVIYYAGHGMAFGGENWLVPIDAELKSDADVNNQAIDLQAVMRTVSGAKKLGLVILDACRENPFLERMEHSASLRGVDQGLASVDPGNDNILISFAARDGTMAIEPTGPHSPFTAALLKNIETPGLEIAFLFRNVHDDVLDMTSDEQEPAVYGSLSASEIYLSPDTTQNVGIADAASEPSAEEIAWAFLRESTDADIITSFVNEYPSGKYLAAAKRRLASLSAPTTEPNPANALADEIGWAYLKKTTNVSALQRYMDQFPTSPHADDARQRVALLLQSPPGAGSQGHDDTGLSAAADDLSAKELIHRVRHNTPETEKAWNLVRNSKDSYVVRKFADAFPTRSHRTTANERLASLGTTYGAIRSIRTTPVADAAYYVLQCDRATTDARDFGYATRGLAACRQAVDLYPNEPRLQYELCLSMMQSDPYGAIDHCRAAAAAAAAAGNAAAAALYAATVDGLAPFVIPAAAAAPAAGAAGAAGAAAGAAGAVGGAGAGAVPDAKLETKEAESPKGKAAGTTTTEGAKTEAKTDSKDAEAVTRREGRHSGRNQDRSDRSKNVERDEGRSERSKRSERSERSDEDRSSGRHNSSSEHGHRTATESTHEHVNHESGARTAGMSQHISSHVSAPTPHISPASNISVRVPTVRVPTVH